MGFQDRDYYREAEPASGIQSMVIKLIIINGALFLADLFFGGPRHAITEALSLQGDAVVHPWMWYQFLTAGFVHDPSNLWHIMGNMLGLYVFGRPLEERYGPREFLRFYLVAIVLSLVTWGLRNYFLAGPTHLVAPDGTHFLTWGKCLGASGGVTATSILFCLLFPRATLLLFFAIPMPAWLFAILLVATNVFGTRLPGMGDRVAYDAHLAGAAFALAYWYFGWNLGRVPGVSQLKRMFSNQQQWFKPRPPLKVHDPEEVYENLDAEADRILEKLSREGEGSLTAVERRTLEDYSRRMRQKLR
jgi:membrane associated rhomboid family serine protease